MPLLNGCRLFGGQKICWDAVLGRETHWWDTLRRHRVREQDADCTGTIRALVLLASIVFGCSQSSPATDSSLDKQEGNAVTGDAGENLTEVPMNFDLENVPSLLETTPASH